MKFTKFIIFLFLFICFLLTYFLFINRPKGLSNTKIITNNYKLNARTIKVLASYGDNLYIGTSEGFYHHNLKTKENLFYGYNNGFISQAIFAISKDSKDNIWIGTYGGGIVLFNKEMNVYNVADGLCDPFVFDIEFDKTGVMWVATWSGANKITGDINFRPNWERFTVENTNKGLSDNWVYAIEIGEGSNIWFGTEVGISLYDGKNWQNWNHKDGMGAKLDIVKNDNKYLMTALKGQHHDSQLENVGPFARASNYNPNYVVSMKMGPNGNLWIGTWGGGLSKFDTKRKFFSNYTVKDGLNGNYVLALEFDKEGNLWIGTNKGLTKFNGKNFVTFTRSDGLYSNFIYSIVFTENGKLWLGGTKNVSQVNLINSEK